MWLNWADAKCVEKKLSEKLHTKTPLLIAEEFFFWLRYNLRQFTDTNSVICKIIVGTGKASP